MTNTQLMFQPLKKYADFSGRARRKEHWLFLLFVVVAYSLTGIVDIFLGIDYEGEYGDETWGPANSLLVLGVAIPYFAVVIRRLHDLDMNGWWILLGLIPFVGLIFWMFFCRKGTTGINRFGDDPLSENFGQEGNIKNASVSEDTTEEKLKEIEQMFEKSLITDEERKKMRDKTLDI